MVLYRTYPSVGPTPGCYRLHEQNAFRNTIEQQLTKQNALDHIKISHRPHGEMDWANGPPVHSTGKEDQKRVDDSDTGTNHPHGTEMIRYHNVGISRTTGIEYTTSVIEALGVEHKETTRYDYY